MYCYIEYKHQKSSNPSAETFLRRTTLPQSRAVRKQPNLQFFWNLLEFLPARIATSDQIYEVTKKTAVIIYAFN